MNLIDSLHCARSIALRGSPTDPYEVTFLVDPPGSAVLAKHRDWFDRYGDTLYQASEFTYSGVDSTGILNAPPRQSSLGPGGAVVE